MADTFQSLTDRSNDAFAATCKSHTTPRFGRCRGCLRGFGCADGSLLSAGTRAAIAPATPVMKAEILKTCVEQRTLSQPEFAAYLKRQLETRGPVIRERNLRPD